MRGVLISIKPKWCELIANGKKTIEVRKTRPKLETPFKGYIYCTFGEVRKKPTGQRTKSPYVEFWVGNRLNSLAKGRYMGNGKVIGEFVCDDISVNLPSYKDGIPVYWDLLEGSCLPNDELNKYGDGSPLYGWHISDLKIYDKPKELSEFAVEGDCECANCGKCSWLEHGDGYNLEDDCLLPYESLKSLKPIFHPPQSWCYVEEVYKHEN